MKLRLKNTLSFYILLFISSYAIAQDNLIKITGTLIEDTTSQPIPYATVVINDTSSHKIIAGTTSDESGKFSMATSKTNFYIEISFMGFETKTIKEFKTINGKIDLGKIILITDSQSLMWVQILVVLEQVL